MIQRDKSNSVFCCRSCQQRTAATITRHPAEIFVTQLKHNLLYHAKFIRGFTRKADSKTLLSEHYSHGYRSHLSSLPFLPLGPVSRCRCFTYWPLFVPHSSNSTTINDRTCTFSLYSRGRWTRRGSFGTGRWTSLRASTNNANNWVVVTKTEERSQHSAGIVVSVFILTCSNYTDLKGYCFSAKKPAKTGAFDARGRQYLRGGDETTRLRDAGDVERVLLYILKKITLPPMFFLYKMSKYVSCEFDQWNGRCSSLQSKR